MRIKEQETRLALQEHDDDDDDDEIKKVCVRIAGCISRHIRVQTRKRNILVRIMTQR